MIQKCNLIKFNVYFNTSRTYKKKHKKYLIYMLKNSVHREGKHIKIIK